MNKVYVITETAYSNAGHGMGSDEDQALARYYDRQTNQYYFPPAFTARDKAVEFAKAHKMAFIQIVELSLQ